MKGLRVGMCDLSRAVGIGSRVQVQDFIFLRISSTWLSRTSARCRGDRTLADKVLVADGELDIRERMLLTLDLKKSMKLLHCSSVASVEEDGSGFRRWFMA